MSFEFQFGGLCDLEFEFPCALVIMSYDSQVHCSVSSVIYLLFYNVVFPLAMSSECAVLSVVSRSFVARVLLCACKWKLSFWWIPHQHFLFY